jgi:hypothetical protein
MRGEADNDFQGDWSESDMEFSPFARQLTITKAKKLIRRHTKKFRSRGHKGLLNNHFCAFALTFYDCVIFFEFVELYFLRIYYWKERREHMYGTNLFLR